MSEVQVLGVINGALIFLIIALTYYFSQKIKNSQVDAKLDVLQVREILKAIHDRVRTGDEVAARSVARLHILEHRVDSAADWASGVNRDLASIRSDLDRLAPDPDQQKARIDTANLQVGSVVVPAQVLLESHLARGEWDVLDGDDCDPDTCTYPECDCE
jgi:hypothetical protein